jgi:hypothetical protein
MLVLLGAELLDRPVDLRIIHLSLLISAPSAASPAQVDAREPANRDEHHEHGAAAAAACEGGGCVEVDLELAGGARSRRSLRDVSTEIAPELADDPQLAARMDAGPRYVTTGTAAAAVSIIVRTSSGCETIAT